MGKYENQKANTISREEYKVLHFMEKIPLLESLFILSSQNEQEIILFFLRWANISYSLHNLIPWFL